MATATHRVDVPGATTSCGSGLVVRATPHRSSTYLDIASDPGIHTVRVEALPDAAAADRAVAGMRRVATVRIDVHGDRVTCRLRGVRHRQPAERPISVGAALAFIHRGVPTLAVDHGGR